MTQHQKIFAILVTIGLMLFILELVRRRRLKEEYTWLWLLTGIIAPVIIIWTDLLDFITSLIGAVEPLTTLTIFSFIFLILIIIHYSVKISVFNDQIKNLAQQVGLLHKEVEDLQKDKEDK
jgi:hypothetical protein